MAVFFVTLIYISIIVFFVLTLVVEYANERTRKFLARMKKISLRKEVLCVEKLKFAKSHILIAIYAVLIIIELFFYVPYHNIQIFKSKQNVPHTEIIGSGYTTMANITNDDAYVKKNENTNSGKRVDTSQLFVNVSITTGLAVAIYFLFFHENKKNCRKSDR